MANLKQAMYHNADVTRGNLRDNDTCKVYKRSIRAFVEYMKTTYGINKIKDVYDHKQAYAQEFADHLSEKGYAPSTIKTYIAGVCQGLKLDMGTIKREKVGAPSKGRDKKANPQGKKEATQPRFAQSVILSKATGLRRNELRNLKISDLRQDESGKWCVFVEHGKEGKEQWQRILPQDYDRVLEIFRKSKQAYIASGIAPDRMPVLAPDQTRNKIDYHAYRRTHAQDTINYYTQLASTPDGRNQLVKELVDRWNRHHSANPKTRKDGRERFNELIYRDGDKYVAADKRSPAVRYLKEIYRPGKYILRGENRSRALRDGWPISYDRIALKCISVFHLAHWRDDVTIKHYMLD